MVAPVLEIYDENDIQYLPDDYYNVTFGSVYGEGGSGFTYLRFKMNREIGHDYPDIGYGYKVTLRKYLNTILFHGYIREIEESKSQSGDSIAVTAFGALAMAEDDEILRRYCDARLSEWKVPDEIPKGDYRPDLYSSGSNNLGIYLHANNNTAIEAGQYIDLEYEFFTGETAERIKCTLSSILGSGTLFDADALTVDQFSADVQSVNNAAHTVMYTNDTGETWVRSDDVLRNLTRSETATIVSIDTGTNTITVQATDDLTNWQNGDSLEISQGKIRYSGASGESFVSAGMTLYNTTRGETTTIESIETANDLFTVPTKSSISSWQDGDDLVVYGPPFTAQISSISGADIVYTGDIGEGNLSSALPLANLTKKSIAAIQSIDTGTNTITVTDADHINGWETDDVIIQGTSLFYATISGTPSGTTITYSNPLGERIVSSATGWVLYNQTRDDFATIDSWNTSSSQLDVTDANDITGWANGDTLRIYSPLKLTILDSAGNMIWPTSDEREGAIPHNRTSINVTKTGDGSTPKFTIRLTTMVSGTFDETSFVQIASPLVYSTQDDVTTEFLAEEVVSLLSGTGHGWDSSTSDISSISKSLEPAVFEFASPAKVMTWACGFGDTSGNRIAWGIRLDDTNRMFLETQDLDTVDYVILPSRQAAYGVTGSVQETYQIVRGLYQDKTGERQYTDWQSDSGSYFNGFYRRTTVRLDNVDNETDADDLISVFLEERKWNKTFGSVNVSDGDVTNEFGITVPVDEIKATGRIMRIMGWRSVEGGRSGTDLRNTWTDAQIVMVEVNLDNRTATLTPGSPASNFQRAMAEISRMNAIR